MELVKKIAAVMLIICLGLQVGGCGRRKEEKPDSVLAQFVYLWEQGHYSGMYNLLSKNAKVALTEEDFCTRYGKISEGIGLIKVKLVQANRAEEKLDYTLDFFTSTAGSFRQEYSIPVVKEEKKWRLEWDHCHIFPGLTAERVVRVSRQMPKRGSILDRQHYPLATGGTVYSIGLVPGKMGPGTVSTLAVLLDRPEAEISQQLAQSWVREDTFVPVQTISHNTWEELRGPLSALPGVTAREVTSRVYDIPHSLGQTVGYVGEVEEERLKEISAHGFQAGDIVGRAGLELIHDRVLAGRPGFAITIRDKANNIIAQIAKREPVDGKDVITTLDLTKIRVLDSALGARTGSILLLDFTNGEIIGAVSKPGFDSNLFALGITPGQYQELMRLDSPFLNRAFNGLYPPGSVFKPFTALMALEQDVFDPGDSWDTPRQWQQSADWGAYQVTRVTRPVGPVDLWAAMKWSDNVYFADLGLKVGWQAFQAYGNSLGFGASVPFFLSHECSQINKGGAGEILLADSSYGQGEMLATPLHMALMYAAIARQDGVIPTPRLNTAAAAETWLITGFSPENIELIDRVLAFAASDQDALAWVGSDTVRGKTGTSEITKNRQIAWYICYFDNLLLAVTLEGDRGLSSTHAVGVARECLAGGIRK